MADNHDDYDPLEDWDPKTELGRQVKAGNITDIDTILDQGQPILEPEITDELLELHDDLIMVGQSIGGARRVFKQTQKKTREGSKPRFTTIAVVGNRDGYVGIGLGKSQETVPAKNKAIRKAKLNVFKIRRGSGSWRSNTTEPHSIPFQVNGKSSSVNISLKPAPKGKGLVAENEAQKVLELAGIDDIWFTSRGKTENKINLIFALEDALRDLMRTKVRQQDVETLGIQEGSASLSES
jgi:small subunit ribosomal protein S5